VSQEDQAAEAVEYGDEVVTDEREKVLPPELMYLGEVSRYRPIVTGDVFPAVPVPGFAPADDQPILTMIVAHPSGMRKGPALEDRIRAAPIVRDERLSDTKPNLRIADLHPLPQLRKHISGIEIDDGPWGVRVDLAASVSSSAFDVQARCLCLSPAGIANLVQCLVHSDTRVTVRTATLAEMLAPKLLEIEWLETWNDDLVRPAVDGAGADLDEQLREAASEFDNVMRQDRGQQNSLQAMIATLDTLPPVEAQRTFERELRARRERAASAGTDPLPSESAPEA
jgi:hypothetical protein